jgi:threonine aldolase
MLACPAGAHVQVHESGSAAALSGVQPMPLGSRFGYSADDLRELCAEEHYGWPPVRLVWLENTLGLGGGKVWPLAELQAISAFARETGRAIHMDGARLWNAHVASGVALATYGALTDTVSVCVSKGLGAPAGSILCGSRELIARARRKRYGFGGGMRQAGILAAGGLHALDHHLSRLAEDHEKARALAEGIADLPCWDVTPPETNLVLARVSDPGTRAEDLCAPLRAAGVMVHPNLHREVRFVLHLDIAATDVPTIVERIRETLA